MSKGRKKCMVIGDIVLLALIVIVCIFGYKKGLLKRIVSFFAWLGTFILTPIIHKPLLNETTKVDSPISLTNFINNISMKINDWLCGKSEIFSQNLSLQTEETTKAALSEVGIPKFLHKFLIENLDEALASSNHGTLGDYFGDIVGAFLFSALLYIAIFLVLFIILTIIAKVIDKARDVFFVGVVDGVLGATYNVLKLSVVVCLIFLLLTYISSINGFGDKVFEFLSPYLGLEKEGFSICKYLYFENPIGKLISSISLEDLFNKLK